MKVNGNGSEGQQRQRNTIARSRRDRKYLYQQLAEIIRNQIEKGNYKPGERLPSMDTIAAQYSVNKVTVRRALAELVKAGLIYSVPAQGTYVAEPPASRGHHRPNQLLTIGLISHVMVPGNTGLYHMEIIEGIRAELARINGTLVILPVKYVEPQVKILDMVLQANLDAAVYLGYFDQVALQSMIANGPPAVLVDYSLRGSQVDTVLVDNRSGGYQAAEHLISLGHRRFAVVTGETDQAVSQDRLQGVYEALDHFGVEHSSIELLRGDFQREGGYRAMSDIAAMSNRPTAVFFMNDEMAAGGVQAANAANLKIPEDISIIGFDDTSWATAIQPPLTTIHVDKGLMGSIAIQRLVQRINGNNPVPTTTLIPTRLIVRDSTAPLAGVPAI